MQIAPLGRWKSPLSPALVASSQKKFDYLCFDGNDLYWEEMRASEGGRGIIVKRSEKGIVQDVLSSPFSARTRVHEYGGKSFAVRSGKLYFVNDRDQRIYTEGSPLTENGVKFADLHVLTSSLIAVGEKGKENFLASIDLTTGKFKKIAEGADFYASVAISPDEKKIAFLSWNHPHMPWNETQLWIGELEDNAIINLYLVAGEQQESIFQPSWSSTSILHFVSDRSGWWNIYRLVDMKIEPVYEKEAEFGLPQWVFGLSTYAFCQDIVVAAYQENGIFSLVTLDPFQKLEIPGTYFSQIRSQNGHLAFLKGSFTEAKRVVYMESLASTEIAVVAENPKLSIDPAYFSIPQLITFTGAGKRKAHGFYYPPSNKEYQIPPGELPPLLVKSHGGPTSCANNTFDLKIQYWTSRGFAVLDIDYSGSTGYGKAYRDRLKGNWGLIDVEDCEAGARYLIEKKYVDSQKVAISGGSAGGFTTLCALTFGSVFTVGASYYGVSDLALLASETHKFEEKYLDQLVAPYPEGADIYQKRSPIFSVDKLKCPIIFFQGTEDKVVPPDQAIRMYEALKKKKILTELVLYEGEGHGFRRQETIRDTLEKELQFYLKAWKSP